MTMRIRLPSDEEDQVKPPPFRYAVAETISDVVELLDEEDGNGKASILAGGQSLIPLLRRRLTRPSLLVDIGRIETLRSFTVDGGVLRLGACVTHSTVEGWSAADGPDVITDAMRVLGHPAVRTFGTVGGSLAYADPAAEWAAVAAALDGQCDITGPRGVRTISAAELGIGPFATTLAAAEVITEVRLRLPENSWGSAFYEVSSGAGDQAIVGAAVVIGLTPDGTVGDIRIGVVGAAATAIRARAAEDALVGTEPGDEQIRTAAALVLDEVAPDNGVITSTTYRRRVAPVAITRALFAARQRAANVASHEEL
jgi:CO/xanthine dehydrogenase FAD-binding subunit